MVNDGLSNDDATLDDIVKKYEKDGTKIQLDNSVPNLSDEDVSKNVRGFRSRVINGDKAAIKKALTSPVYAHSPSYSSSSLKLIIWWSSQQVALLEPHLGF